MAKKKEGKPISAREKSLAPEAPLTDEERDELAKHDSQSGDEEPIQAPLIPEADMPPPVEAIPIQNNRVAATYVGMGLARDKKDEKLVFLEFSFKMTKHHAGYVPDKVSDAFKWLERSDNKLVGVNHISAQTVDIFEDPKEKKPALRVVGADVQKAMVQMIEESGKGKTTHVIRFSFRLLVERSEEVIEFAAWRDEEIFWLKMGDTQGSIK